MTKRQIYALAAFLYLFLAPFTYHPDIKTIFYLTHFLSEGVFNIYSYIAQNPEASFLGNFVYPPLAYFIYGILYFPLKTIAGGGFTEWLSMGNDAINVAHIFQYLFSIKLPAIIFHFATGFLILQLLKGLALEKQKVALVLWFFNPISIYIVAFMGQIDSLVVFLTVLSLFLASKKPVVALITIGLAAAVKTYPLLLLPFLAIYTGKTFKRIVLHFCIGFLAYAAFIIPFLTTEAFYSSTLVSGLSQRIFSIKIPLGLGIWVPTIPAILVITLFIALYKGINKIPALLRYFLFTTFITVSLIRFHPQWALWFLPFLVMSFVDSEASPGAEAWGIFFKDTRLRREASSLGSSTSEAGQAPLIPEHLRLGNSETSLKEKSGVWMGLILVFIGWMGIIFLFEDKFLSWGILSPIEPEILFLPSIASAIDKIVSSQLVQYLFQAIFLVSGGFLTWRAFKNVI